MSYVYGTWGYALDQARDRATRHGQRMHLYKADVNGRARWVVAWDPKESDHRVREHEIVESTEFGDLPEARYLCTACGKETVGVPPPDPCPGGRS